MVAYKKDVAGISSTADPGVASAKSSKKTKQKFKYKPPTSSKKGTPTIAAHVSAPIAEAMPLPEVSGPVTVSTLHAASIGSGSATAPIAMATVYVT